MVRKFTHVDGIGNFKRHFAEHVEAIVASGEVSEKAAPVLQALARNVQEAQFTAQPKQKTIIGKLEKLKAYQHADSELKTELRAFAGDAFCRAGALAFEARELEQPTESPSLPSSSLRWTGAEKNALKKAAHNLANDEEADISPSQRDALKSWANKLKSIKNPSSVMDVLAHLSDAASSFHLDPEESQHLFEVSKDLTEEVLGVGTKVQGGSVETSQSVGRTH